MFLLVDLVGTVLNLVTAVAAPLVSVVGAIKGDNIAEDITDLVQPIAMVVIGIVAITFLFRRQLMQFFQFIILGAFVYVLLDDNLREAVLGSIGKFFKGLLS